MTAQGSAVAKFVELSRRNAALRVAAPPAGRPGRTLFPSPRSQDAPRLGGQELAAHHVEVRQGKHRPGAREVLREPAVADLREAPEPLHDVERVFAAGPGPRPRPIDGPLADGQWPVEGGPAIHAIAD